MMKVENRLVCLKDAEIDYRFSYYAKIENVYLKKMSPIQEKKSSMSGMIAKYSRFYTYDSSHFVK